MIVVMTIGQSIWLIDYSNKVAKAVCMLANKTLFQTIKHKFMKRIKDLSQGTDLKGLKIKTKKGVIGYYFSGFETGIFFNDVPGEGTDRGRLYPQVALKKEDILEWEIIDDPNIKPNCDSLTTSRHIIND